jgi:hypothetical protein
MLLEFVALGLLSAAPGGGGGSGPYTDTGDVIVSAERTVVLAAVQDTAARGSGIALGAGAWRQQFDPADHAPFAFDFDALLDDGEKIVEIETIYMNATAALLGVGVDTASGYGPLIDEDGQLVQIWFVVDEAAWDVSSFDAGGVQLPVTVRVITDGSKRYERTGVLTVRQQ